MQRKRGLEIGRPLGFPLLVHGSWFPAGALLVAHLTISAYGGHDLLASVLLSVATALVFFVCVAIKEIVQAVVAAIVRAPFADVTLYIFGGIARPSRPPKRAVGDLIVAAAGPLTAGALATAALEASHAVRTIPHDVLWTIGVANIALALANLLPGTPLDGGRAVVAILGARRRDRRAAEVTAAVGGRIIGALAVTAGGAVVATGYASATETAVGLWLIVGGIIVATTATRARRAALTLRRAAMTKAGDLAMPFAGRVSLDEALPGTGTFAVADGGRLAGVVSGRTGESVRDAMVPWSNKIAVGSGESVAAALGRLANGSVLVVVDDNGTVRGVLERSTIEGRI
jgi:Zn-dependent protease